MLAEREIGGDRAQHAAALLTAIDEVLAQVDAKLDDLDYIALSVGPGSFTGLRIGLATTLGLCFAGSPLVVPVPTLAALAQAGAGSQPIVPMLDARKGQVYAGVYAATGECLGADRVVDPLPFLHELATFPDREIELIGPGARLYQNEIRSVLGARGRLASAEAGRPRARHVAAVAARLRSHGVGLAASAVELCYLRPAEAEQKAAAGHRPREPIS